jgi:tetratricopeptide (TPR) repeat protein
MQQPQAYGNLGNTFKSLKNYESAIKCCENHLRITREQKDQLGEGRACYNLGNVHHAVGKAEMQKKKADPSAKERGVASIRKAIVYYKDTLQITGTLKDTAGEGRAVGNLGNAYTAIGEYEEAIKYHKRRYVEMGLAQDRMQQNPRSLETSSNTAQDARGINATSVSTIRQGATRLVWCTLTSY